MSACPRQPTEKTQGAGQPANLPSPAADSSEGSGLVELDAKFGQAELLSEALERASAAHGTDHAWYRPALPGRHGLQMRLKPERWAHWGITIPATQGGVDWQFSSEPAPCDLPNHPSAGRLAAEVGLQLDALAALGCIEFHSDVLCPANEFVTHVHPLAAIMKPSGDARVILDPTKGG